MCVVKPRRKDTQKRGVETNTREGNTKRRLRLRRWREKGEERKGSVCVCECVFKKRRQDIQKVGVETNYYKGQKYEKGITVTREGVEKRNVIENEV